MAQKIVNEVAVNASAFIGDKMEVTAPKIIDEGQFPTHKAGPNMKKNALLGITFGIDFKCRHLCSNCNYGRYH